METLLGLCKKKRATLGLTREMHSVARASQFFVATELRPGWHWASGMVFVTETGALPFQGAEAASCHFVGFTEPQPLAPRFWPSVL